MINVDRVRKLFDGGFEVDVNNISFKPGLVTSILGKNGAGKSTLIRLLFGTLRADEYLVKPSFKDAKSRCSLAIMFEGNDVFYPRMSVLENARYFSKLRSKSFDYSYFKELGESIGLSDFANTECSKLSTGNKRKASLLILLSSKPNIAVFDEPTLGLDLESVENVKKLILKIKSKGCVVILTSHDVDFFSSITDEFYYVSDGKIDKSVSSIDNAIRHLKGSI